MIIGLPQICKEQILIYSIGFTTPSIHRHYGMFRLQLSAITPKYHWHHLNNSVLVVIANKSPSFWNAQLPSPLPVSVSLLHALTAECLVGFSSFSSSGILCYQCQLEVIFQMDFVFPFWWLDESQQLVDNDGSLLESSAEPCHLNPFPFYYRSIASHVQ